MKVDLHQGSALSPFLFAIVMDRLTDEVRQEALWTKQQAEDNLERWRYALECRGDESQQE